MTRARAPLNLKLSREMKILLILLLMVALIGGWYVWTSTRSANVIANSGTGTTGTGGPDNGGTEGGTSGPVPIEGAPAGSNTGGTTGTGTAGAGTVNPALGTAGAGTTTNPDGTSTGNGTDPTGTVGGSVAPDGTVTIPTLPPLGNVDGTLVGPNGEGTTVATPAPGGINPDTALVLLPGVNPFRPLSVKADPTAAGTTPTGSVTANANPAGNGNSTPNNTGTLDNSGAAGNGGLDPLGTTGGAVAISPIPGSGDTVPADSVDVTGGAFPLPTIPGGEGNATDIPNTDGVIITPGNPTVTPDDTVTANNGGTGNGATASNGSGNGTGNGTGTSNSGSDNSGDTTSGNAGTGTTPPPVEVVLPPIKPPVAGVRVPGVNRVPNLTANAGSGNNGAASGANGTGTGAAGTGTGAGVIASLPTTAPRPGTPQVITELTPLSTGTPAETTRPLDQNIAARELAFNAVVLGPVNTAIFRSKDGFLVVSVGQTLPDSDIVIKEVTATSATLALGNDTQTLELDKR
ncbi:hypothetical protein E7T06_02885 [Deinococcus sp. Arct2-2]|uniref:hypothetical protein n=1 Tax=Deinococcus sp. Arct2-2 TaxID=2568653 RepID=UPI0010A4E716|nr:hypothetical protein [Deinococcus sp. Arct2-2]THF71304.1 hypothetical protein E7T06_02885 [Deinococcus sp. Arct2-2]